jgi:hypothetical protein
VSLKIEIEGYDRLMDVLKDLPKEKLEQVDGAFEGAARDMAAMAKRIVSKDKSFLHAAISVRRISEMEYEYFAQKSYAPYLEWGTLSSVSVPGDQQEIAIMFKGKGIRQGKGVTPRPFFYPPFYQIKPKLIQEIKEILTR